MDIDTSADSAGLRYTCPHCGAVESDEYEVLLLDATYALSCNACRGPFHLALLECSHCGEEAVHVSVGVATPNELRQLKCPHCGRMVVDHEDELRGMGLSR